MTREVVLLFNHTFLGPNPWARRGYSVHCYDRLNKGRSEVVGNGRVFYHPWESDAPGALQGLIERHPNPHFVGGFPPCTDLSVAGNAWRKRKELDNPNYLQDALARVLLVHDYAEAVRAPYFIENPVGLIPRLWKKWDHMFKPCDYGGYLPEDDEHPIWPSLCPPRDAYSKKTCLWTGCGFIMPEAKPVPIVKAEITCSSWWTDWDEEKVFRSATPRGFMEAVVDANG